MIKKKGIIFISTGNYNTEYFIVEKIEEGNLTLRDDQNDTKKVFFDEIEDENIHIIHLIENEN